METHGRQGTRSMVGPQRAEGRRTGPPPARGAVGQGAVGQGAVGGGEDPSGAASTEPSDFWARVDDWVGTVDAEIDTLAPGLREAQAAWMAQIDSLCAPDRRTHELIRMVCMVVRRNPQGVAHYAMLAAEVGASWEDVAGSILVTQPAFGLLNVVEALPWARRGWERGTRASAEVDRG